MTAFSNYAENALLDHLVGNTAFTAPTNTYVKLHTGDPGEDCTGNAATEDERKQLTWAAASSGVISTSADVTWTDVAATETYSHISIWDASTGGNPLGYGALGTPQPVGSFDDFVISSGDIDWDLTTGMLTTATANAILDHVTGRSAWTQPAGHFIKVHLDDPGASATANPAVETTRADAGSFSAASGGSSDNDAAITLSSVSTTEDYTHISGWDASTGGNALYQGALTATKNMTAGQDFQIPAGSLVLALQ